MATLDSVVGIKSITTDADDPVPTRGTVHVTGPTASVYDDPEARETVLNLASLEGTPAHSVTGELDEDVEQLNLEGQDLANVIRLTVTEENVAIQGIAKPTLAGNPRKTIVVLQGSVGRLELQHNSEDALADERLTAPGGESYYLLPDSSIDVLYDGVSDRWIVIP